MAEQRKVNLEQRKIEDIRHSLAHVLAMAVLERWPAAKLGVGPTIENGFYYDFELPEAAKPDDLPDLEKRMRKIIAKNLEFTGRQVSFEEAREFFSKKDQPYKLQLIDDLAVYGTTDVHEHETVGKGAGQTLKTVGLYQTGDFVDLCRGGHVNSTREFNAAAFRLTKIAGAYWRGSEKNPMLTRIYAVAFENRKELDLYFLQLEEAARRDHRKLGESMDLFTFSPLVGSGLPLYTPRGALLRRLIQNYVNDFQEKAGYHEVWTPQVAKAELFKISGHYEKFKGDMFRVVSNYTEDEMFLKPMNCPNHTQIYASKARSWRDLPVRYADFAMLYRDEKPGELGGLSRTRAFSQDDGHSFCREDQIEQEFDIALGIIEKVMKTYGLSYWIRLSLSDAHHPEKYLGDRKIWEQAEQLLESILKKRKINYKPAQGEAAFYGPKMDLMAKDSLGREWQLSTIQLDFQTPGRFGLTYTDKDGSKKTPVMIHRAINGSLERFLAIIIEHYAGAFPLWLAPVQVAVIPISDKHAAYGKKIFKTLLDVEMRAELWDQNESVGKRIRRGELEKIPYLLIVGDKEKKAKTVSVRERGKGDIGTKTVDSFIKKMLGLLKQKR